MERFCSDILTSSLCPGNGMRNVFRRAFVLEGGNFVCEMPVTIIRLSSCGKIENPDYLASFDRGQPVVEGNRFHCALRFAFCETMGMRYLAERGRANKYFDPAISRRPNINSRRRKGRWAPKRGYWL